LYGELLKSKGLKSTPQRLRALKIIEEAGHIDIDQLSERFNDSGMKIPLATLYRILGELSSAGILHTVTVTGQKTRYEIAKGDHPHFLCEQCGQLEDLQVAMNEIVTLAKHACAHTTRSVSVMLHGTCENCTNHPNKNTEKEVG
jgi:Fe2+ or Zn2+ uptake regulation protein